tara:strand:+ start:22005 stop:22307 length:303 start_codon:yes stop_codon:yes gene_type:complete
MKAPNKVYLRPQYESGGIYNTEKSEDFSEGPYCKTNISLIKEIFSAGYRLGRERGESEATCYERGIIDETKTLEDTWDNEVTPMLKHHDVNENLTWENIW